MSNNADTDDAAAPPFCALFSTAPQQHRVCCMIDQGNSTTTTTTTAILTKVAVRMEKMKQVLLSLVVVEGVVQKAEAGASLKIGKTCLVHIRKPNNVQRFLEVLDVYVEAKTKQATTRWTEFPIRDESFIVVFQIDVASRAVERNRKGTVLLECHEILSIHKSDEGLDGIIDWNEIDDIQHSGDSCLSRLTMNNKSERHRLFASWLIYTYGLKSLSSGVGVLDVAGGNGELSAALLDEGVRAVVLLDPNPRLCERATGHVEEGRLKIIADALYQDGSHLTDREDPVAYRIRHCSIVVGMHPDQATEPIVDLAQRLSVPFAVLPCCVMPSLFPHRRQKKNSNMPVRSYRTFCQYLLDKAPEGSHYYEANLTFVGRNRIIYSLPG